MSKFEESEETVFYEPYDTVEPSGLYRDGDTGNERIIRANAELRRRIDPERVASVQTSVIPWSRESKARAKARAAARSLSRGTQLDIFKDDLRSIRIANEMLNRAATMRAVEAAETTIFEIRCRGESIRLSTINRIQLDMTRQFVEQLQSLESFKGRMSDEILDALKERAFSEFTMRMNRASKADAGFQKSDTLKMKP